MIKISDVLKEIAKTGYGILAISLFVALIGSTVWAFWMGNIILGIILVIISILYVVAIIYFIYYVSIFAIFIYVVLSAFGIRQQ